MTSHCSDVTTSFIQSAEEGRDEDISAAPFNARARKSSRIFSAVRNAVIATKQNISTRPSSGNSTPAMRSKRSHSTASQLGRDRVLSPSNHDPSCTCPSCNGWMEDRPSPKKEEFSSDQNDAVCLISDGPFWVFQLAKQGKVKQLAALCNANPDRLLALDRKGANILHHAAVHSQTEVMGFVISSPGGTALLSERDDFEATPLHWAVERDLPKSVGFLLDKGADPMLGNNSGHGALHLAVQHNSLEALKVLIQHKVDKNSKGNAGVTPLHIAAMLDHADAFQILLDAGAKPCLPCSQGYRPLHRAAISGSKNVMRVMLEHGEKYGYTREQLLSFGDKEQSSPLHSAVTGGNIGAIKLCLEYGARLDVKQADDSTPMHMVCGQGNIEIVKLMFEQAPTQAQACLHMLDKRDHTPLHKAAMFNHPTIIHYLAGKGANLESLDTDQRTPLLLAATRECWASVRALIKLGANCLVKDKDERNMMHIIVLKGGDICNISSKTTDDMKAMCESLYQGSDKVQSLISKPDAYGCAPLHYACQEGNLASLKTLLRLGVNARLKSWKNQSALHFASMYGRFNACSRLLDSDQGPNIINEKDEEGMTPLHYAAMNGHVKVVILLMNRGALVHRNSKGETPLHVAALNGYTKTIRTLIEMHCQLIDQVEEHENTALHHASKAGHVSAVQLLMDLNASFLRNKDGATCFTEAITNLNHEVALAIVQHDRWEEAMRAFQKVNDDIKPPIILLIQHLPEVCVALLNRCMEHSNADPKSPEYWIRYHFKYLQPPVTVRTELRKQMKNAYKRMMLSSGNEKKEQKDTLKKITSNHGFALPALNAMVECNRVKCLRHPVSVAYLRHKWNSYGKIFHTLNLIFYLMSLFPITYIVSTVNSKHHWERYSDIVNNTNGTEVIAQPTTYTSFQKAMMIQLTVINCLQIVKELVQMCQQKRAYFLDVTNLVEWTLYVTSVLYACPFLTGYPIHWQFEMGAVAIFLAWYNLLVFLQKFGLAGTYVVMFLQILKTLIQVVLVFSFLIIAFALSFTVLMQNEEDHAFRDPGLSIMRVMTMFLGEISYVEKFLAPYVDDDPNTNHFSTYSFILLIIFILMVPILLMNLLIGLAVGDIAEVQANAVLQRLAMQVHLHTAIELRLPSVFLERVDKNHSTIYPNICNGFLSTTWHKIFQYTGVQADYGEGVDNTTDPHMEYLQSEVYKQKQRMKQMQTSLDKQHALLRLIVQKMEISSEADYKDEGYVADSGRSGQRRNALSALPGASGSKLLAMRAFKSRKH